MWWMFFSILYGGTAKEEPNIIVKVGEHNEYEAFVSRDKSTNKLVFKMNPETAKQYLILVIMVKKLMEV